MFRLPSGKSNINGRMCRPLGVAYAIRFADIPPGLFGGTYRRGQVGDHDQRGWRGPRLRTCEAVRANPKQTNNSNAYVLHTYIHYILMY